MVSVYFVEYKVFPALFYKIIGKDGQIVLSEEKVIEAHIKRLVAGRKVLPGILQQ